jgi:DeoR/GlpR family transcriptional regulator of sugar metabolism
VVLVATHEVFTSSAPARVAPLERLTGVVTDRPLPQPVVAALRRADVVVHIVER